MEMIQLRILVLLYVEMERKLQLKDETTIILTMTMDEAQHEHRKSDGHVPEETQELQTLELRIEEMELDLIQISHTEMWDQLLVRAEILHVL